MPIFETMDSLIDEAYERVMRERRRQAAGRLIRLQVEDPPDAATIARELESAHEPGGGDWLTSIPRLAPETRPRSYRGDATLGICQDYLLGH